MNMPPPRPGYRRDPDPEGRWDAADGDDIEPAVVTTETLRTEWNVGALFMALGIVGAYLPVVIILWRLAI